MEGNPQRFLSANLNKDGVLISSEGRVGHSSHSKPLLYCDHIGDTEVSEDARDIPKIGQLSRALQDSYTAQVCVKEHEPNLKPMSKSVSRTL